MNCQDGCRFKVERDRAGELEQWCSLIGGRTCYGVTRCSGFEPKVVKDEPKLKPPGRG
jgi:hypothetical protein